MFDDDYDYAVSICEVCGTEFPAEEAYQFTSEVPICSDTCWEKWRGDDDE